MPFLRIIFIDKKEKNKNLMTKMKFPAFIFQFSNRAHISELLSAQLSWELKT